MISHSLYLFFELVLACVCLSCSRHQKYVTAEPFNGLH